MFQLRVNLKPVIGPTAVIFRNSVMVCYLFKYRFQLGKERFSKILFGKNNFANAKKTNLHILNLKLVNSSVIPIQHIQQFFNKIKVYVSFSVIDCGFIVSLQSSIPKLPSIVFTTRLSLRDTLDFWENIYILSLLSIIAKPQANFRVRSRHWKVVILKRRNYIQG